MTSAPSGIACGTLCSWSYPGGTTIVLTATPDASSSFAGWSGACSGTGTCTVNLTAAAAVSATFALSTHTRFSDDFGRADSVVLGNGWTESRGNFSLQQQRAWNSMEKTRHLALQPLLAMSSGQLAADFTSLNNNAAPGLGLVFGYRDPLNYYAAYQKVGGTAVLKVVRVVNGVETVLASAPCANPLRGTAFRLLATFAGDKVTLTAPDRSVTAVGLSVNAGGVGFMIDSGGWSHTVDNFARHAVASSIAGASVDAPQSRQLRRDQPNAG